MKFLQLVTALLLVTFVSCKKDPEAGDPFAYDPTPYVINYPTNLGWTPFPVPADNPMTNAGVELGKKLFFDPILSINGKQSCASCHHPERSFTDTGAFSLGAFGQVGNRNSMVLFNLGWAEKFNLTGHRFFWDGGANTLEMQAVGPMLNPLEMANHSLFEVVDRLRSNPEYPNWFRRAFGSDTITSVRVAKAIAQFERTLISSNSPYDQAERRERVRTQSEINGMMIFVTESKGDCFHCHGNLNSPYFTDFGFHNNGLDEHPKDSGLFRITGNPDDMGKFKTPSLRNLAFTGPYMHDGRFRTLQEVIEFYNSGTKNSVTVDPFIAKHIPEGGLNLTPQEKSDLLAFLMSLNDSSFLKNSFQK